MLFTATITDASSRNRKPPDLFRFNTLASQLSKESLTSVAYSGVAAEEEKSALADRVSMARASGEFQAHFFCARTGCTSKWS
jgi:hypothetical protein